jgi:hypothetical protein
VTYRVTRRPAADRAASKRHSSMLGCHFIRYPLPATKNAMKYGEIMKTER